MWSFDILVKDIQLKKESLLKGLTYISLLSALYYSSYQVMFRRWQGEDYNYCYLIPFVVLYLLWEKLPALKPIPSKNAWTGIIPLLIGICFFWIGELSGEYYSLYLSSWFVIIGLCWSQMGWPKFRVILFPIAFILTMFPPPNFFYYNISLKLKLISSKLGVDLLQVFGMSAYREGNVIDLGFTQLQVVDACSGLRYLIPLIVLAILVAYFSKGALWEKIVLVISAIPISIFINSFRIASVGMLYPIWGRQVAEGFLHDFSGWLIFMVSLAILLAELALLNKFLEFLKIKKSDQNGLDDEKSEPKVPTERSDNPGDKQGLWLWLHPPQFIISVILLGATMALSQGVEFREKVSVNKPFHLFPLQIEEWSGKKHGLEQQIIEELDFTDYITADYVNPSQRTVSFYTAFYESQSKGESIHSPESCLPGGGWVSEQSGELEIPLGLQNRSIRVNRTVIRMGDYKQLVYYWFPSRGRILTNAYELKLYTFWDALTRQRTDGALVRVLTPVYPYEKLALAEERLQGFVSQVVPLLDEFLPQ
jgi:exosortase D (VPLPA-CTERM-specific)